MQLKTIYASAFRTILVPHFLKLTNNVNTTKYMFLNIFDFFFFFGWHSSLWAGFVKLSIYSTIWHRVSDSKLNKIQRNLKIYKKIIALNCRMPLGGTNAIVWRALIYQQITIKSWIFNGHWWYICTELPHSHI